MKRFTVVLASLISLAALASPDSLHRGNFTFNADDAVGTVFTNDSDQARTFQFTVSGTWHCNPEFDMNGPDGIAGTSGITGYWLVGAPVCSVVAVHKTGDASLVGSQATLTLQPHEKINFTCNDDLHKLYGLGFDDNYGSLNVEWSDGV